MGLVAAWIIFSIIVGVAANTRGRSGFGWFLLALVTSPLIAGLLVLALPRRTETVYGPIRVTKERNFPADIPPAPTRPSFNVEKREALVRYDPEIAAIADKLRPLGQRWVDEFARAYLALNDKQYLPNIVSQLLADARAEQAREQEEQKSAQLRSEQANAQRKWNNKVAAAIAVVVLAIAAVAAFLLSKQQEAVTAGTSEPQAVASLRADKTTVAPAAEKTTASPPPEAASPATPAKKMVTASTKRSASGDVPKGDPRDPNEANRRLMGLSEDDRRAAFYVTLNMSGERCSKVTRTFYQGSAKPTWNALWSIECEGGPSYQVLVMSDEKGSTKVLTCGELRAIGGGECFKRY